MKIIAGSYTALGGPGLVLMDMMGDQLQIRACSRAVVDPIWAEQSKKRKLIYVAGTQDDGEHACAAVFGWEKDALHLLSCQPNNGTGHCHLCLNEEETYLYCANYSDGSVAVYPLDEEGNLLPLCQFVQLQSALGPNRERQERNHAHQLVFRPGTKELFLCDLGADRVVVYLAGEDGKLVQIREIACTPGSGPRHLCFDGPDAFYLVGELGGWLSRFEWGKEGWQQVQHLSTLPDGHDGAGNTAAAIRRDEGHIYVSNRGHNSIAVFKMQPDGKVLKPYFISTPGAFPRDFLPMNGGFLLAQQQSGTVAFMNENGVPGAQIKIPGAVSLLLPDEA